MWKYRVPTFRHRREPVTADDEESISLAKFADADEDALPLDRPRAPNCVDLRKFLQKRSGHERLGKLSSTSDDDSPIRTSSRDDDDKKVASRSRALEKLSTGLEKPNCCPPHLDGRRECGVDDGPVRAVGFRFREEQGSSETRSRGDDKGYGLIHRKLKIAWTPFVNGGDDVICNTFPTPKSCRLSHIENNVSHEQHEVAGAREISRDNVFVRSYYFVRWMFATLSRFLLNSLMAPFRIWKGDRKQILETKKKSHDCRLSERPANTEDYVCLAKSSDRKRSDEMLLFNSPKGVKMGPLRKLKASNSSERGMDEAHFDTTKTADVRDVVDCNESRPCERHLGDGRFDMTTIVDTGSALDHKDSKPKSVEKHSGMTSIFEMGKIMKREESKSSSRSETSGPENMAETGTDNEETTSHLGQTSSKAEPHGASVADVMSFENPDGHMRDKEVELSHATKQELAISLNTSKLNRETLSAGTSAEEEDSDAWLWHKIESSEKWMDESERLRQETPVNSVESPLRFETPKQLQCGTHFIRIDSSNEYTVFSPEPEARKMVEKKNFVGGVMNKDEPHALVGSEIVLSEQNPIRRKTSRKSSRLHVHAKELRHGRSMEEGVRVPKAPRLPSASLDAHPLLPEADDDRSNQSLQQFKQDQYVSSPPITPVDVSGEPKRKASIRSGLKNDVKAVTETVKRVLLRNKPEPDTRFTSPRSAQKTLTIIADVMVKEFECMVAVRRTGAFKIRSEKIYSSESRLRTTMKFRALDAFSCNVIICRSRDDDFTVPTADYVNFVAGLQQRFLNSVTGAWRYQ
ncbi:hypothetical protein FGB62_24g029 [Gracilaria domingensis]|nr:hypothetical protein FGB62_24g029 [Gracilaria domingensis]